MCKYATAAVMAIDGTGCPASIMVLMIRLDSAGLTYITGVTPDVIKNERNRTNDHPRIHRDEADCGISTSEAFVLVLPLL
ncbi:MAG: hypothetical protein JRE40_02360 [Deltaproteobacteria bacterium]|nr:hypothetical protein [Deltaproteobacteria bacterium]